MLVDILYVSAAFVGSAAALEALAVPRAGAIAVLVALAVATSRLRAAGKRWSDLGLTSPKRWSRALLWALAAYALVIVANALVVIPLTRRFSWPPTDVARLGDLAGNLPLLVSWLVLAWTTAAFGEELLFRGFLQARLSALFGDRAPGIVAAIILQAVLFGLGHLGFGIRGGITAAVIGIVYGAVYAVNGRNLWPLILAHGITDSVSLIALYFGAAAYLV
jgi:membrane protease YdiL (CAAX protease family)